MFVELCTTMYRFVRMRFAILTFCCALGCYNFEDDVVFVPLLYLHCVYHCNNTAGCLAISYNNGMNVCRMHFKAATPTVCGGYILSKKKNWGTKAFMRNSPGLQACEVMGICPEKEALCSPFDLRHGTLLGNRFSESQMVKVVCFPGYIPNGSTQRTCVAGNWFVGATACIEDPKCVEYLVSGPNGVDDSQLSASTNWCKETRSPHCPSDGVSAIYALLHSKGFYTGAWMAGVTTGQAYIQVDFLNLKIISAIVLKGRESGNKVQYVTEFMTLLSKDCNIYQTVKDARGNDKRFVGTTDRHSLVIRPLPSRQRARCVRIQPTAWINHPSLRFDVQGC